MKRGMMITAWEDQENPRNLEIEKNEKLIKTGNEEEIKAHVRVTKIEYAIGFFLATNFAGKLLNGMKFYLTNNHISRLCRVEIKAIVSLGEDIVSND